MKYTKPTARAEIPNYDSQNLGFISLSQAMSSENKVKFANLFMALYYKYRSTSCVKNRSKILLGIDVLRGEKKKEILKLVTLTVENKFIHQINTQETLADGKTFLAELIQESVEKIILNFYGVSFKPSKNLFHNSFYITNALNESNLNVALPFYCVMNPRSDVFRRTFAPLYNSVTNKILEILFDNLIITISECVIRIILNDFFLVADIRQTWFRSNFLSTRNLERFKNNLAWQDRKKFYFRRPRNIYNNEYEPWILTPDGFYLQTIYANRLNELINLNQKSLVVINYLEFQDFFICRLEETIVFVGQSTRNILTYGVGQGIGLIWKGIIEALKE
uniref:hypothetical chloroplast RF55 n=1 Tax=Ochrosphaera neapolitana TaxID=35137 RepID=UPI00286B2A54|nr:hypothetical chloroplast RF55 [Ochrosphaera neapolitana]WKK50103.1 hypothetical chloroplast RF55 [Ochrosphaera neapolitana]